MVSLLGDKCKCAVLRWVSPRHYTVDPIVTTIGNPIKCHKERLSLQPLMIPPKRIDIFPPDWGMLRRSTCVHIFLQTGIQIIILETYRLQDDVFGYELQFLLSINEVLPVFHNLNYKL